MRSKYLILLLIGLLVVLQTSALVLYFALEDDIEEYNRELIIKVRWNYNSNSNRGNYSVIFPLLLLKNNDSQLITILDEIEIVQGRCNLSTTEKDGFFGLVVESDTDLLLRYNYREKGENLNKKKLLAKLSSISGDIDSNSASITIFANRSGLHAEEHFYQQITSSGGHRSAEFLKCSTSLTEGWSRYPLAAIKEDERITISE